MGDGIINVVDIVALINIILGRLGGGGGEDVGNITKLINQIQRLINSGLPNSLQEKQLQSQINHISKIIRNKPKPQKSEKQILIDRIIRRQDGKK